MLERAVSHYSLQLMNVVSEQVTLGNAATKQEKDSTEPRTDSTEKET